MVYNPYAAGSKIYNGASSAATSGTVDPSGYVDRGLNQQASQRRSGLAQAALNSLRGGYNPMSPQQRQQAQYANANDQFDARQAANSGVVDSPFGADTSLGQIAQLGLGSSWDGKLRFGLDQDLLAQRTNALQQFDNNRAKLNTEGTKLNRDYILNRDKMVRAAGLALQGVQGNFAGRGMFNSTGRQQTYDLTQNDWSGQLTDLRNQRDDAFTSINNTAMDNLAALQSAIRDAIGQQLQRNAATARSS